MWLNWFARRFAGLTRLLLCLLVAPALWIPAATPVAAAPAQPPGFVLTRHVVTPLYQLTADGVTAPGLTPNDVPGAPALPVWSDLIELPGEGTWEISIASPGARLLDTSVQVAAVPAPALPPAPAGGWVNAADAPTFVPTAARPDPAIYQTDAFYPPTPAVTGPVQVQRGRRWLPLRVFPFQANPRRGLLRYHPDLTITIRLTPTGAPPAAPPAVAPPPALPAGSGALRVRTSARGFYRLTYDNLIAAGVPVTTTDPATFAMSAGGQALAIQVKGEGDGHFDPGDLVIFYAEPYQGRYEASNVSWFTYGGAPGLRMATRAVTPNGAEPLVTTITQTVHLEFDREYRSDFPRPQNADHWFDTSLSPDALTGVVTVTRPYDLPLDDPLSSGMVQMRAVLHGGSNGPTNPNQSIAISLNNHALGVYQWAGVAETVATASAPAAWLDATPNRINLVAALSQLPGLDFYSVSPDWVELTYPALAEAENDRLYVEALAPGANEVAVAGFSTPQVQVYDVRNGHAPVQLTTTQAAAANGAFTLHFWDADLPGPTYVLTSEAAQLAPLAIEPDAPSTWRTPAHAADYIAIVHASLAAAIQPLLDYRAGEGLRVAKVDVQDIYDEFSFGLRDPEAIRSFLTYAYGNWNGGGARPQYVLLVGDGHYDFTGVSGTTYPNLIPPYLVNVDPWLGETAADNRFVCVDGSADYLPDMAIGRIPARTPADVTAFVNKAIAYETSAPAGDWQARAVFVADSDTDPAGNFHAFSDEVRLGWLPAPYESRTIYYNRDYFSAADMRTAIKAAFNNDALLIQWFGHGSKFRWGSVSMFNTFDPPALAANDAWPFSVTYACWTGYFINLFVSNTGQSLAETLLLTPQRGSVADLSPSGLHVGDALLVLDEGLTQALFRQRLARVGQAVDEAKRYYFGHAGSFYDVIDTSVLFGDPALKLRLPPINLSSSTLTVSPSQAAPAQTLNYTVTLQNSGTFTATDVTVAVDYAEAWGQVSASHPPAVAAGGVLTWTLASVPPGATPLTFALQLAPVLPAGLTAVHAPTAVRSWGNALADLDAVSQVSAAPDLTASSLAASRAWAPPAAPLTYTFTLSNTGNAASAMTWLTATLPNDLILVTSPDLTYAPATHRLTWQGAAPVASPLTLTFSGVISPTRAACGQITVAAALRDQLGQTTLLSAAVNLAVPDVDCDGDVDAADVQQVAAAWSAAPGRAGADPHLDLDGDGAVGILDIIIAATRWR